MQYGNTVFGNEVCEVIVFLFETEDRKRCILYRIVYTVSKVVNTRKQETGESTFIVHYFKEFSSEILD